MILAHMDMGAMGLGLGLGIGNGKWEWEWEWKWKYIASTLSISRQIPNKQATVTQALHPRFSFDLYINCIYCLLSATHASTLRMG